MKNVLQHWLIRSYPKSSKSCYFDRDKNHTITQEELIQVEEIDFEKQIVENPKFAKVHNSSTKVNQENVNICIV